EGLLMAVAVEQDLAREGRGLIVRSMASQELGEEEGLAAQPLRARIGREQVAQLVAKDRGAARLENDHRPPGVDLGPEAHEDAPQVILGTVEEAEIVQWPAATQALRGDGHAETGILEDGDRRLARLRVE